MKVRNGFVSNSSSSSYIVGIPFECVTFDSFIEKGLSQYEWDIQNFEEKASYLDEPVGNWETHSEICKTNRDCIRQLWDDIGLKGSKVTIDEMIEMIDGFVPETNFYMYQFIDNYTLPHNIATVYSSLYGQETSDKMRKKLEKMADEWNHIVGEALIREISEYCNTYAIIYSDNDGEGLMEHGDFWKYVLHVRINQH